MVGETFNSSPPLTKTHIAFIGLFLFYLFLLPLPLGSNREWSWSLGQLSIFSITLCFFVMCWEDVQNTIKQHRLPIYIFSLVIIWIFLQWIPLPISLINFVSPESAKAYSALSSAYGSISLDRVATLNELLKTSSYLCVFILGLSLFDRAGLLKLSLIFIVLAGTYNGFYGAFEILSGQDFSLVYDIENGHRASGTFVYHNHFANFLILCLSAGLGYFITSLSNQSLQNRNKYLKSVFLSILEPKIAVRLCLTIMVIALVMSRSRMGNTAFFISLCSVSFLYIIIGKNVPKSFKILVISMLVIDVFVVSAWFGLEQVAERLEATSLEAENRDEVVIDGLSMLEKFPITGSGAGSFEYAFPSFVSESVWGKYQHAHNDYLEFLLEYGFLVTLMLGLLILHCLYKAIIVLYTTYDKKLAGAAAAAVMAIVGMLIHMSVDFPLRPPANASYFIFLLSIACTAHKLANKDSYQLHLKN